MTVQRFTDGYVEWTGFEEDGDELEGTAEVKLAVLRDDELEMKMDYEFTGETYTVRLRRQGPEWRGTHRRPSKDRALPVVGSCSAVEQATDSSDRCFKGRWVEDDVPYRWTLILRGSTTKRGRSATDPPPPLKPPRRTAPHPDVVPPERPAPRPRGTRKLNDLFKVETASRVVIHDVRQRRGLQPPVYAFFDFDTSGSGLSGRAAFSVAEARPKRLRLRVDRKVTQDFLAYLAAAELTARELGSEMDSSAARVEITVHSGAWGVATLFSESTDGDGPWFAFVGHRLFGVRWPGTKSPFASLKRHLEYDTLTRLFVTAGSKR